jgi:hypothetical protein
MADHYVVVRPSAISFNAKDDKWHATMNANADQLKAAPRCATPWLYTGATQPFCSSDDRLREITPTNPHQRWTVSRSSMISRRNASLHLRLQNLLPHQRCVTIPNGPPQ